MAKDLTLATENPVQVLSSPALQKLRRVSLGTVKWPDLPERKYLAGGLRLTDNERAQGDGLLAQLKAAMATGGRENNQILLALVAKMLLAYPMASQSAEVGKARGEAYAIALNDVPPWAVNEAIRKWHRGTAGDYDYTWAPSPAVLRALSLKETDACQKAIADLEAVLSATTIDEAMDPKPKAKNALVPSFKRV